VPSFFFKYAVEALTVLSKASSNGTVAVPPAIRSARAPDGTVCTAWTQAEGGTAFGRPLTKATQEYDVSDCGAGISPVHLSMPKMSAFRLAGGEAEFTDDAASVGRGALHAAFVTTNDAIGGNGIALGTITTLDVSAASSAPGVVGIITHSDVQGTNDIGSVTCGAWAQGMKAGQVKDTDLLFAVDEVTWAGQPVCMIIATTRTQAEAASKLVKLGIAVSSPPVMTIAQARAAKAFYPKASKADDAADYYGITNGDPNGAMAKAKATLKGSTSCGGQFHFHMEKQTAFAVPEEGGQRMLLQSSTQNCDETRLAAALALGMAGKDVTVKNRRLGGAYGGKITASIRAACCVGVAAQKYGRPVKMQMDIYHDMSNMGGE
jgi:xanthine dehydrogenase large subunit